MSHPKVSVVVLNWNGKADTLECLDSVLAMDYPNFDVVVVDNCSTDGSVPAIRKQFPWVTVVETGANLGYAGGNNVGMRHAIEKGADYVLLLNNDTVVDRALLTVLVRAYAGLSHDAILTAQIFHQSDPTRIWYAGATVNLHTGTAVHQRGLSPDRTAVRELAETDYASGCAFFVSTALLSRVGLFDEKFFLMYEETDFCFRARAVAGARSYVVRDAKVWHKVSASFGGVSSPLRMYFLSRNRLLWAEKHLSRLGLLRVYGNVLYELLYSLRPPRLSTDRRGYRAALVARYGNAMLRARLQGIRDYILRRSGKPKAFRL